MQVQPFNFKVGNWFTSCAFLRCCCPQACSRTLLLVQCLAFLPSSTLLKSVILFAAYSHRAMGQLSCTTTDWMKRDGASSETLLNLCSRALVGLLLVWRTSTDDLGCFCWRHRALHDEDYSGATSTIEWVRTTLKSLLVDNIPSPNFSGLTGPTGVPLGK